MLYIILYYIYIRIVVIFKYIIIRFFIKSFLILYEKVYVRLDIDFFHYNIILLEYYKQR